MITNSTKQKFIYLAWGIVILTFFFINDGWNRPLSAWVIRNRLETFYDSEFGYYSMSLAYLKNGEAIFFQHPGVLTQFLCAKFLALFSDPYHSPQAALNVGRLISVSLFATSAVYFCRNFSKFAGISNCVIAISLMFLHPGLLSILTEFPNNLSLVPSLSLFIMSSAFLALKNNETSLRTWTPIAFTCAIALAINLNFLGVVAPLLIFIFLRVSKKLAYEILIIGVALYSFLHFFNSLYIFSPLVHIILRLLGESMSDFSEIKQINLLDYSALIVSLLLIFIAFRKSISIKFLSYIIVIQLIFIALTKTNSFDLYLRYFLPQCGVIAILYVITLRNNNFSIFKTLLISSACITFGVIINNVEIIKRYQIAIEASHSANTYPQAFLENIKQSKKVWLISPKPGFLFDIAADNHEQASLYYASYFYANENIFNQPTGLLDKFKPIALPANHLTSSTMAKYLPFFHMAIKERQSKILISRQQLFCKFLDSYCDKLFWWLGQESFVRQPYAGLNLSLLNNGEIPDLIILASKGDTYSAEIVEALTKDLKNLFPNSRLIVY